MFSPSFDWLDFSGFKFVSRCTVGATSVYNKLWKLRFHGKIFIRKSEIPSEWKFDVFNVWPLYAYLFAFRQCQDFDIQVCQEASKPNLDLDLPITFGFVGYFDFKIHCVFFLFGNEFHERKRKTFLLHLSKGPWIFERCWANSVFFSYDENCRGVTRQHACDANDVNQCPHSVWISPEISRGLLNLECSTPVHEDEENDNFQCDSSPYIQEFRRSPILLEFFSVYTCCIHLKHKLTSVWEFLWYGVINMAVRTQMNQPLRARALWVRCVT